MTSWASARPRHRSSRRLLRPSPSSVRERACVRAGAEHNGVSSGVQERVPPLAGSELPLVETKVPASDATSQSGTPRQHPTANKAQNVLFGGSKGKHGNKVYDRLGLKRREVQLFK